MVVNSSGLIALLWILFGFAFLLSLGRWYVRRRVFGTLLADDILHALAVLSSLVFGISFTIYASPALNQEYDQSKHPELEYLRRQRSVALLDDFFFWLTIYLVKFAFLALYRYIFGVSRDFKVAWWAVSGFTFVCFWVAIAVDVWRCDPPTGRRNSGVCGDRIFRRSADNVLWVAAALHCVSDVAIMALPLWQLRSIQLRNQSAKLGFVILFLLGLIGTLLDFVRVTLIVQSKESRSAVADYSVCKAIEPAIALILSALIAYQPLITRPEVFWSNAPAGPAMEQIFHPEESGPDAFHAPERPRSRRHNVSARESSSQNRSQTPFEEQITFIQHASPIEKRFYRLWLVFLERQNRSGRAEVQQTVQQTREDPG